MAGMIQKQLQNPWVMAAVGGGIAYMAIVKLKPKIIYGDDGALKNPMISPITVAAAVAVASLMMAKSRGKRMSFPQMGSSSPTGLMGPESFRV